MFRFAGELGAKFGVLRRHTDWASIEMALAHHDTSQSDQRSCRKTEFLGAKQSGDDHIASRLQSAVGLKNHAASEVVENQR